MKTHGKLRTEAEKELQKGKEKEEVPESYSKLIHELQVHQIELEMQNQELRDSQIEYQELSEKYFDLYNSAPVGYFTLNKNLMILDANLTGESLLGIKKSRLNNNPFNLFIKPQSKNLFYNKIREIIETRYKDEFELELIKKDKSTFWALIALNFTEDERYYRITITDITELKKIENRLKASEEFYKTLFENTGTASIIVDEDTTILMANTQFEKLSGYSKESVEGKMSWKEMVSIEYLEIMEKYHYMRRNGIETPESYETQLIDMEGNVRFVLISVAMIPGTKRSIASLTDLTERKKMEKYVADSERNYRFLVEKATAGMFILDEKNIIKYLNDYMAQILGYEKNEMLERPIKSFIQEKNEFYRHKKPSESKIKRYDKFKFLDKEGNVFWSNLTVSPVFDSNNKFMGLLGVVTDMKVQKGLEKAFSEREELFTDIIYDMMEMINKITKETTNQDFNKKDFFKNLDNN